MYLFEINFIFKENASSNKYIYTQLYTYNLLRLGSTPKVRIKKVIDTEGGKVYRICF